MRTALLMGSFAVELGDQVPIPPLPEVGGPGGWWRVCWDGGSACPRISHSRFICVFLL